MDKYQPQLVWFDWWIEQPAFQPYLQRFAAYYYNRGAEWKQRRGHQLQEQVVPGKGGGARHRARPTGRDPPAVLADRHLDRQELLGLHRGRGVPDRRFDHRRPDRHRQQERRAAAEHRPESRTARFPDEAQKILLEIGSWLEVNGEAIYGTRPWKVFGEGPTKVVGGGFTDTKSAPFTGQDIRFTTKGDSALRDRAGLAGIGTWR